MNNKERTIRATYDDNTIVVYQAYNSAIAEAAMKHQTFACPPFKLERMTWIKPSFFWMMYRSGWASKENQEHILSIRITRSGFEWALRHSCLSHFNRNVYASYEEWETIKSNSPVLIQWDPERDRNLNELPMRTIQIGLSGDAVNRYLHEWIVEINDVTALCKQIKVCLDSGHQIEQLVPKEKQYYISDEIKEIIGSS